MNDSLASQAHGRRARPPALWRAFIIVAWITAFASLAAATEPDAFLLSFRVRVPPSTPQDGEIWIAGGIPSLGSWNGRGLILERQTDGSYAGTVPVPPGTFVEFKVTRGGWETVEKSKEGREIRNRSLVMPARPETAEVLVEAWRDQVEEQARVSTVTGTIQHHPQLTGKDLRHDRDVWVWLPPGYESHPAARYPVLYMHDGQNVFDAATSFIGLEWEADETATRLIAQGGMEPVIIVAVANTSDRTLEYAPPSGQSGGGDAYGRFLVEELKPFIDRTYRTRPEVTGLAGSSLGGLITLYLGLEYPGTFTRLGLISPAVFWNEGEIFRRLETAPKPEARIWLDVGTLEGVTPQDHERWLGSVRALRDALLAKGFVIGGDLAYLEDEGAVHNEGAWAGRLERILRFLFPPEER